MTPGHDVHLPGTGKKDVDEAVLGARRSGDDATSGFAEAVRRRNGDGRQRRHFFVAANLQVGVIKLSFLFVTDERAK